MLSYVPLALYLVAAWLLTRDVRGGAAGAGRLDRSFWVAVGGFLAHCWVLFAAVRTERAFTLAITDSASLVGWVVAGTTLVAMASVRLAALAAGWLSWAAVLVLVLTGQNKRLRARQPLGLMALLPPIETVERLLFAALSAGFAVLTLALVTGFFFVYNPVQQHLVHKMTLAILAWLIFAVLLWGRYRFGWRGRQALRFTIGGFVMLALAYFGSKFVLEVVLGEHWG